MDARIEALHSNNDPPSDEVEQEIRKLLLTQFQDLQKLDSEILNLEIQLKTLTTKRNSTQDKIHLYQSFLSPIRRMPPEVLGLIFYRCLPTHRNPIIKMTECPLLLTHVCRFWRAAAISEPQLWARIHITFSNEDTSPNFPSNDGQPINEPRVGDNELETQASKPMEAVALVHQLATKILRRRLDIIKEWLSRSGTRPLSVSLCFMTTLFDSGYETHDTLLRHNIASELFEFLAELSPRFEDLELNLPHLAYYVLERKIDVSAMTRLTSFRAELHDFSGHVGDFTPITLLKAPHLQKISMSATSPDLWGILDPSYASWRGVTDISCHGVLASNEMICLLEHTPNLVRFKATIFPSHLTDPSFVPLASQHISLPFLRTFSLTDQGGSRRTVDVYNRIDAPGLTWVEYTGNGPKRSELTLDDYHSENTIVGFLQRLPTLKKLMIDAHTVAIWGVGRIFRAVPSVTYLIIGYKVSPSGSRPIRWRGRSRHTLNLEELIAPRSSESNLNSDLPLLPNLVSLDLCDALRIEDESLIRFIISRIKPPSTLLPSSARDGGSEVAPLTHVGVVFNREKERDIEAEVQEHAEYMGADMIDLVLDYPETSSPQIKAISQEYGLRPDNGRSWDFEDVEEFTVI